MARIVMTPAGHTVRVNDPAEQHLLDQKIYYRMTKQRRTAMKTYLSYRRTVSKNYQSETEEFGFEVVVLPGGGAHAKRAHDLCRAIVNHRLGQKIGLTRRQLDVLSKKFFNTPWQELTTGVAEGDEQL